MTIAIEKRLNKCSCLRVVAIDWSRVRSQLCVKVASRVDGS